MFDRRLYWHEAWACDLQNSFILGWSPGYLKSTTTVVPLGKLLNLSEHQTPRGGEMPWGRKIWWAQVLTGGFKQDNGGKALGMFKAQDECSVKNHLILQMHFLLSRC